MILERAISAGDADEPRRRRELLSSAGVGPQTLDTVLREVRRKGASPRAALAKRPRLWDAVARLAIVCQADPVGWVRAFGAPVADAAEIVERARERLPATKPRRVTLLDRAERAIAHDASGEDGLVIRVGLLRWEPLTTLRLNRWWPADAQPRPDWDRSFAAAWVEKAIGTVIPENVRFEFSQVEEIDDLIGGLGVHGGKRTLDAGVGLFDLPQRRRMGMWFSSIPGFEARLAGLCFHADRGAIPPTWEQISAPDRSNAASVYPVVTGNKEAAWAYLRGPIRYPPDRIRTARSLAIHSVVSACAQAAESLRDSATPATGAFVLVTDEETRDRVRREFRALREDPDAYIEQHAAEAGASLSAAVAPEPTDPVSLRRFAAWHDSPVPDPDDIRPRYNVTICFAPGEERLYKFVRRGKVDELFGNAAEDTARLYAEFCAQGARAWGMLQLRGGPRGVEWRRPDEPPSGLWSAHGFSRPYLEALKNQHGVDIDRLERAYRRRLHEAVAAIVDVDPQFNAWLNAEHPRSRSAAQHDTRRADERQRLTAAICDWLAEPWGKDRTARGNKPL